MKTAERRKRLIKLLYQRSYDTAPRLAEEFGVSSRTIMRDIDALSKTEPIYTRVGNKGGIFVMNSPYMDKMYLTEDEISVLKKLSAACKEKVSVDFNEEELKILDNIIKSYTKPSNNK